MFNPKMKTIITDFFDEIILAKGKIVDEEQAGELNVKEINHARLNIYHNVFLLIIAFGQLSTGRNTTIRKRDEFYFS